MRRPTKWFTYLTCEILSSAGAILSPSFETFCLFFVLTIFFLVFAVRHGDDPGFIWEPETQRQEKAK